MSDAVTICTLLELAGKPATGFPVRARRIEKASATLEAGERA